MHTGEYTIPERLPKEKLSTKRQVKTLLQWCPWFDRAFLERLGRKQAKVLLVQVKDYYRQARGYGIPVAKASDRQAEEWQVQETLRLDPGFDPNFLRELGSSQIQSVLGQAEVWSQKRWSTVVTAPRNTGDTSVLGFITSCVEGVVLFSLELIMAAFMLLLWCVLVFLGTSFLLWM